MSERTLHFDEHTGDSVMCDMCGMWCYVLLGAMCCYVPCVLCVAVWHVCYVTGHVAMCHVLLGAMC